jgi:hypothetical protein
VKTRLGYKIVVKKTQWFVSWDFGMACFTRCWNYEEGHEICITHLQQVEHMIMPSHIFISKNLLSKRQTTYIHTYIHTCMCADRLCWWYYATYDFGWAKFPFAIHLFLNTASSSGLSVKTIHHCSLMMVMSNLIVHNIIDNVWESVVVDR